MALLQHLCKFPVCTNFRRFFSRDLDLGGSILTGIGIGVPAIFLSMGIKAPVENFGLALLTGALLGLAVGGVIVLIRKFTINQGNSTFGADVMMGLVMPQDASRPVNYFECGGCFDSYWDWCYIRSFRFYIWKNQSLGAQF